MCYEARICFIFFFNDTATTEIYTLSLHDALPIFDSNGYVVSSIFGPAIAGALVATVGSLWALALTAALYAIAAVDRKSTRLNSSHSQISYAVFCLKKKKNKNCRGRERRQDRCSAH